MSGKTNSRQKKVTRRDFVKGAVGASAALIAASCAPPATPTEAPPTKAPEVTPGVELPYTVSTEPVTLKADFYLGGYGEDWFRAVGDELNAVHPNITVEWNFDALIDEAMPAKFVAGEPADLIYICKFDLPGAALEGQLLDVTPFLEAPAYGQEDKKVIDTLIPGALDNAYVEGKPYLLPMHNSGYLLWYDEALFEEKGWPIPTTFDEMMDLFKDIRTDGIYPLVHQGIWPFYWLRLGMAAMYDIAGIEHSWDCDDLVPGAWKHEAVRWFCDWTRELLDKDYILPGSPGLDCVPSQMEFIKHNAAFVSCGDWLENEMEGMWPPDFRLRPLTWPHVDGGKGKPNSVVAMWFNWYALASAAEHPNEALEFTRIMYSKKMDAIKAEMNKALCLIKGASEGVKYSDAIQGVADYFAAAPELFCYYFPWWYPPMRKDTEDALTNVFLGEWGFEEFSDAMEQISAKYREDPTYFHRKRERA